MSIFGIFNDLLSTLNVNVARFARNVETFSVIFKHLLLCVKFPLLHFIVLSNISLTLILGSSLWRFVWIWIFWILLYINNKFAVCILTHPKFLEWWLKRGPTEHSVWNSMSSTVFENHRKSLIQHCEGNELCLHFERTKVN